MVSFSTGQKKHKTPQVSCIQSSSQTEYLYIKDICILTSMEVNPHSKRGAWHRYQGIRFIWRVQRNATDALVHRVEQKRAHAFIQKCHTHNVTMWSCESKCCTLVMFVWDLAFTGLLATLQTISSRTHAGSCSWWSWQAKLRAVAIVLTAEVGTYSRYQTHPNGIIFDK